MSSGQAASVPRQKLFGLFLPLEICSPQTGAHCTPEAIHCTGKRGLKEDGGRGGSLCMRAKVVGFGWGPLQVRTDTGDLSMGPMTHINSRKQR